MELTTYFLMHDVDQQLQNFIKAKNYPIKKQKRFLADIASTSTYTSVLVHCTYIYCTHTRVV